MGLQPVWGMVEVAAVEVAVAEAVAVGFVVAVAEAVVVGVVAGAVVGPAGVGGLVGAALAGSGLVGERDSSWVVAAVVVVGARTVAEGVVAGPSGVRWGSC